MILADLIKLLSTYPADMRVFLDDDGYLRQPDPEVFRPETGSYRSSVDRLNLTGEFIVL